MNTTNETITSLALDTAKLDPTLASLATIFACAVPFGLLLWDWSQGLPVTGKLVRALTANGAR